MKTPVIRVTILAATVASSLTSIFGQTATLSVPPPAKVAPTASSEQDAAITAVEANPDSAQAHDQYEKAMPGRSAAVLGAKIAQYKIWEKKFPDSAEVVFRLGALYANAELPDAKPYLLKAVKLNPKNAPAYQMLAFDSERWGSEAGYREYMHQASLAAPSSPDYAFYYVFSYRETTPEDHVKWTGLVQDFAKLFPTSERGAQALYWLGSDTPDNAAKIAVYEQEKVQFPPNKFRWSASAMEDLFSAYIQTGSTKALALAQEMKASASEREAKAWDTKISFAQSYLQARTLFAAGENAKALAILDTLPTDRRAESGPLVVRFRAEVTAATGNVQSAYDVLLDRVAGTPEDVSMASLKAYGTRLGKTDAQIEADIWLRREASTKPSPKFDLGMYTADKKLSLDDLRGKVVLLTFWFPGCGPCRGEFPHFETVLAKFHGQPVTYVGINVDPKQDSYVLPFMAGTRYSFIPLRSDGQVTSKDKFNVRGEPSNFLIDQTGRIVYSNFRASNADNELVLQRMIESLLAKKTT